MSDDEVADLTPEDDAAVSAVLAALPELSMPDDVAARIAEALAAEPPWSGPVPPWAAGGSDNVTVLPSQQEREQRRGGGRWRALTGVAAGVAVFAGLVVVGTNAFDNGGGGGGANTAGGAPQSEDASGGGNGQPVGALLTSSGTTYSAANLDTDVTGLVNAASVAGAPKTLIPGSTPTGSESPPASGSPTPAQAVDTGRQLVTSPINLGVCLGKLDRPAEQPIAADAGRWTAKEAVVIVLDGAQAGRVDVFVVAPPCGDPADPDPHLLFYKSISSTS